MRLRAMFERRLRQPGPAATAPFESLIGSGEYLQFTLKSGLSINEAIALPLAEAGLTAASIVLEGGSFAPLHYLMPALSTDDYHAAWYSETNSPEGEAQLERGNVTFGERDGHPFIHCHATWIEAEGRKRCGHVLPHETIVAKPIRATAWGTNDVRMVSEPDAETAFTLFHPIETAQVPRAKGPRIVVARVRPNVDIIETLEEICRASGFSNARLRGGVGSLIGARYADGTSVDDIATEVFVIDGFVSTQPNLTRLEIVMVDTMGRITQGQLLRGKNPVCITFELYLEEA